MIMRDGRILSEVVDLYEATPTNAWITVNRACNLKCGFCYGKDTGFDVKDSMSLETALKALDMCDEMGIKNLTLIGGEPLIWSHVLDFLRITQERGFKVAIATNGMRFADDAFWKDFLEVKTPIVGASIKGVTPEMLKKIAGSTQSGKVETAINRLVSVYEGIGVHTVYSDLMTFEDLKTLCTKTKEWGSAYISISFATSTVTKDNSTTEDNHTLNMSRINEFVNRFDELSEIYQGHIQIEPQLPLCYFDEGFIQGLIAEGKLSNGCFVNTRSGVVFDTNLDALVCNSIYGEKLGVYNKDFSNGADLLGFLNKPAIKEVFKELSKFPSKECEGCKYNKNCRGGCVVNWLYLDPSTVKGVK